MIQRIQSLLAAYRPPRSKECVLCGSRVAGFLPYRRGSASKPMFMRAMDVVGSDVDNFGCPRCSGHDRERHLLLYLRAAGLFDRITGGDVLHFAPERRLSEFIRAAAPARYIRCDLHPGADDVVRVDLLAVPYPDASFDIVIANHVLEHVADDRKALSEIRRVLKIGGHAILQTPYSSRLHHTWEDPGIDDDSARLQAHGQEDHVRLYGLDIFERIAACGLQSRVRQHDELLADVDARRLGVNPREPFMLFQRRD